MSENPLTFGKKEKGWGGQAQRKASASPGPEDRENESNHATFRNPARKRKGERRRIVNKEKTALR